MDHSFNLGIAIDYNINSAIILNNIAYWTAKKIANNKDFYEGKYWIYNSYSAWTDLFPYWSFDQIKRIINSCLKNNLLNKGNFNKKKYDKTNWYSLTENSLKYYPHLIEMLNKK